eukprot:NODE_4103_length_332_cov_11.614841_g4021_i0.p1 GENE.NODE_4103_length_332_cov_11.614841_g4021_i0~~NODE_4103_length_332_cov_11.614841_g4021_i0.p1  ORF type:complete len:50 (-),score=2.81 NODE_4103_length_332_cov_11.614841_g4021_i0:117-266(-)
MRCSRQKLDVPSQFWLRSADIPNIPEIFTITYGVHATEHRYAPDFFMWV